MRLRLPVAVSGMPDSTLSILMLECSCDSLLLAILDQSCILTSCENAGQVICPLPFVSFVPHVCVNFDALLLDGCKRIFCTVKPVQRIGCKNTNVGYLLFGRLQSMLLSVCCLVHCARVDGESTRVAACGRT